MKLDIQDVPARRVAYLRGYGRYPDNFPKLWPRFTEAATRLKLLGRGKALLSIMHDDMHSVPAERLRGDAAVEVAATWKPTTELQAQTVPGGLFAVMEHLGPYEQLAKVWTKFIKETADADQYRLRSAASYEIYLNDPKTTPPLELRTMLYLPVEKK
jgi:AraC family transcriptional regulator